ncbi:MAG: TIR domain-containing protein, partial [Chloroflexi bacterium]
MPRIFISYRRADSRPITGRIHEHLVRAFGDASVFMDVSDIPAGIDYKAYLAQQLEACDVALIVIGDKWLSVTDADGRRRLDNPEDVVRHEVQAALERPSMRVIPVLVNGASMPNPDDLPEPLRQLHYRNAALVRDDPDFTIDMQRLIRQIGRPRNRWRWLVGGAAAVAAILIVITILILASGGGDDQNSTKTTTAGAVLPTSTPTDQPSATPTPTLRPEDLTPVAIPQEELLLPQSAVVYAEPDESSPVLLTFNAGKRIKIVGQNSDRTWLYVQSAFNQAEAGWITGDWIAPYIVPPTPTPTA